jgi:transposase-like protein
MPRPEKLERNKKIVKRCLSGETVRKVAGDFGLHWTTVHKIVQRHRRRSDRQVHALAKDGEKAL